MAIQDVLGKLGQWSIKLRKDAPPGLLEEVEWFGHVVVAPGRIDPVERGDDLLAKGVARYVGILRDVVVSTTDDSSQTTLSGVGLAAWLGDEDGKCEQIESPGIAVTGASFAAAVAALVPAAVPVGTIYTGVTGTITNTFIYQSRRAALDYLCTILDGEWRVNADATLDAGPASALYQTTPTALIVRKADAGYDQTLKALPGSLESTRSAKDYTTRVVLVAQALAGGTADAATVPYRDMHGNPVVMTRIVDETTDTVSTNATARAQSTLNLWSGIRRALRLSATEFDIAGDFVPGDVVWCYDPDAGIADTDYEVEFRGRLIQPMPVRVREMSWPVTAGHTVAYRIPPSAPGGDPTWIDLTPWVEWESGQSEIVVSDSLSTALTPGVGGILTVVPGGGGGTGDTAVPDVPVFGTFTTTAYQPGDGLAQAAIQVTWTQPLNTDASTIVDGDHYEVRYRPTGLTDWQVTMVGFDQTSVTITALSPNTTYEFQIRAVDYASPINAGAWSATTSFLSATDTTPPATPAAPTVAASEASVQVTHTLGLASGGTFNLPLDMDHLEVHVGPSSGYTPDATTWAGDLNANGGMVSGSIPAVGSFRVSSTAAVFVKVIAVDKTGNKSTPSSAATVTALLWDSAHISDLTASKITAGTMSAAVILGGSIKTGTSGKRVEQDADGIRQYNASGVIQINLDNVTGTATFAGALSAATGTFAGSLSAATGTFAGALSAATGTFAGALSAATGSFSGTITASSITGGTYQTAASGARVVISSGSSDRITFYSASGDDGYIRTSNTGGTDEIGFYSGSGNAWLLANNTTCSLNATGGVVSASASGAAMVDTGSGSSIFVTGGDIDISTGGGGTVDIHGATTIVGHSGETVSIGATTFNLSNVPVGTGVAVLHVSRRLYVGSSARRFKTGIEPAAVTPADVLTHLAPITYLDRSWVDEHDGSTEGAPRHYGFIADDLADGPLDGIVFRDEDGAPFALAYDRIPALHQVVLVDHEARIVTLEGTVADLTARLAALEASASAA